MTESESESEEEKAPQKKAPEPAPPVQEVTSLFDDMGFGSEPAPAEQPQSTGNSLLAAFETPSQPTPQAVPEQVKPQAPDSSSLIGNLGNLYAANAPPPVANPFAGFGAAQPQAPGASNPFGGFPAANGSAIPQA